MALAALSSMVADTSAACCALIAASIAAPCILGRSAAQPQSDSSPSMLVAYVGSGSCPYSLAISSASASNPGKSTSYLTASAAAVFPNTPQSAKAGTLWAVPTSVSSKMTSEERLTRHLTTVASIGHSQPCRGLDGYTVHPAAADSSLHLAAVAGNNKGPSRVPVGFGAYKAGETGQPEY